MTEDKQSEKESTEPQPDASQDKSFLPELLKKPNLRPTGFKYVPPKGSKRHF